MENFLFMWQLRYFSGQKGLCQFYANLNYP